MHRASTPSHNPSGGGFATGLRRHGFAVACVLAGLLARGLLSSFVGPTALPFITFFPAVVVAAWYGGLVPGLVAVLLASLSANWFFIEPVHTFAIGSEYDTAATLAFLLASILIVVAMELLHRQRAKLAETNEHLSTTLASIGDGVLITDERGRVRSMNAEAERLTGWTRTDAAGLPLTQVFRIIHEETGAAAESPVERVLREGRVVALANHTVLVARDGHETPIEDSAAPIRRAGGPILGVVLVFRDATEQRRAFAARAQLATIVEHSGDAIFTKDLNGTIQTWNDSAERLFGFRAEEIVGKSINVLVPPELQDQECEILESLRRGVSVERLETTRLAKGGRRIFVSVTVSPLRDSDGRVIGASKIVHDISERIAAQEALHQEKELLATTLASIGDAVIVTDAQGRITFLNGEAERLTGWTNAGAQGKGLPEVFRIVNEQTRSTVEDPVEKVLRLGSVVGLANHTVLIAQDGTEHPIDDSAAPIRRTGGDLFGVVLVFRDISARRQADRELRESEQHFRLLADAAPVLIWMSGTDRRCTWFNKSWLDFVGRAMEQEVGDGWAENVHPEDYERCVRTYVTSFDAREAFSMTYRLRRHDGEHRWILDRGVPRYDSSAAFTGYIGSCVDVTDSVLAEEARRQADRRKDEFLAILSHELRNPLAPIRMAVSMLHQLGPPDPELVKLRDMIERQTAQLARLLDDLLDVSRISSGKIVLRKEPTSLGLAIASAVEAARPSIRSQRHELNFVAASEAIQVEGDPARLAQVFTNLLHNASKYTLPGGRITVSLERQGSDAVVRVRDSGIGLAPDQLIRVFDMFAQVDASGERGQGGLGVGLALSRTLVQLHGGRIEAHSEGLGKGSEFTVRLPVRSVVDRPKASVPLSAPAARPSSRHRILVADDNADSAEVLAWALRRAGHEVRVALDGAAAIAAAGELKPQMAILDIGMPQVNGYDAARQIRAALGDTVVLVAMTGWGQDEDRRRAREAGFDHHLTKPVDLAAVEQLVALLESAAHPERP